MALIETQFFWLGVDPCMKDGEMVVVSMVSKEPMVQQFVNIGTDNADHNPDGE